MLNPLQKQESFTEKVSDALHLSHKQTKGEKIIMMVQKYGIYFAIFVAGYLVARIQTLVSL